MADATIQLSALTGIWRPVYAHRLALHATADTVVLAAWRKDTHGISLGPAVAAWRQAVGESTDTQRQHRRQAAAAAVLVVLAARSWRRTRRALATAAQRAHRAGWAAGHHLVTQDHDDDTPYDTPGSQYVLGAPDMPDDTADATATAVLTAALKTTANRAGRAMADSTNDPQQDAEDALEAGLDLALAADVAVSAAYGAGMLAAYLADADAAVQWLTAGDERVCETCLSNEAAGPYSLLGAPTLPAHPRCRCCLAPA